MSEKSLEKVDGMSEKSLGKVDGLLKSRLEKLISGGNNLYETSFYNKVT